MRRLLFLGLIAFLGCANTLWGATTDSEGMPVVYLRGEFGYSNWAADNDYKFTRDGDTYTLHINALNPVPEGKFKIADEDWNFDFGASYSDMRIEDSGSVDFLAKGGNVYTKGIYSGSISFRYPPQGDLLNVTFDITSTSPDVSLLISGTLPVMYINVYDDASHSHLNDEITDYNLSHKNYFTEAEYWLDVNGCEWMEELGATSIGSEENPLPLQIKARGNWTRVGFSKKPFKIKLDKKQNLLGLTPEKSKHYALLAHADDVNGYLRNFTAFNIGERIGLPWTPAMQPVEIVINGDYRGLYFLTESIRVGDGRVEIAELDDLESDPDLVSGGYIVELDNYEEENQIKLNEKSWATGHYLDALRITYDSPEEYSDIQKRFITDQFSAINNAIGTNNDDAWRYLDIDDAARYYLVWEIISHVEAFHGSTYLYRDRGTNQKWHFSPLWDAGNAFRGHTDQFFYNCDPFGNTWIPSMRENSSFNSKVKETWLWFMQNEYQGIEEDMDEFASHIQIAAKADNKRWSNQPHPKGGQGVANNSDMNSRLREVKELLNAKINWLKSKFGDFTAGSYEEPARDTTPAAELPDYVGARVQQIQNDFDSTATYYNLQGIAVTHLQKGEIYIMVKGNIRRKVLWFGN